MHFEIHRSPRTGQFWFRIVSAGRVLSHSEQYALKAGAQNAIQTIRRHASTGVVRDLTRRGKP